MRVELARKFTPGRIALRLELQDAAGRSVRRYSGSVFMDQWIAVLCAVHPLNRGERVNPATDVSFLRKNMAYLREPVWDGKGSIWRVVRPVGTNQRDLYVCGETRAQIYILALGVLANGLANERILEFKFQI